MADAADTRILSLDNWQTKFQFKTRFRCNITWTSIGHAEDSRSSVLQLEVFVAEFVAVDRLAAGPVVVGEITTLEN